MTYQQWNHHHYQAIPESRPLLMQPWQHEFGCPVPRPRSFSLGSRPTGTDLMQVSSKRMFDTSTIILPVDPNQNYWCNNNYTTSSKSKNHSRKCGWTLVFLLLIVTSLTILGWWKLRQSPSIIVESDYQTDQVSTSPVTQQQQNQQPLPPPPQQSVYHPLPPPPAPLIPPGSQQQQYYAQQQHPTGWQQPSPQQQQQHYQHIPPAQLDAHRNYQQQYQQQYVNPQYSYPQQNQQPHYGQQQQVNPHQHHAQHYANHQPEISYQGEQAPRKSWTMEHVDNPAMPLQDDIRHQQHHHHQPEKTQNNQPPQHKQPQQPPHIHQQQQPPPPPPPPHIKQQEPIEPALSRQEERAKVRNQARTMNPIKNTTKVQNDEDIWEEKMPENQTIVEVGFKLRLEPAQFSFSETVVDKDGTVFMTSFEDDEDVTVEVIEDA